MVLNFCFSRVQLGICLNHVVRYNLPGKCTQIVDKISMYLQSPDPSGWMGVLLYSQIVKHFEYVKKVVERAAVTETMNLLLTQVQQLLLLLELARAIANRPVPEETLSVDDDERPEIPW